MGVDFPGANKGSPEFREDGLLHCPFPLRGAPDAVHSGSDAARITKGNPLLLHPSLGEVTYSNGKIILIIVRCI